MAFPWGRLAGYTHSRHICLLSIISQFPPFTFLVFLFHFSLSLFLFSLSLGPAGRLDTRTLDQSVYINLPWPCQFDKLSLSCLLVSQSIRESYIYRSAITVSFLYASQRSGLILMAYI